MIRRGLSARHLPLAALGLVYVVRHVVGPATHAGRAGGDFRHYLASARALLAGRTPYVLERVRNAKLRLIEPFVKVPRERLGRPGEALREGLSALVRPSPMRSNAHRPDPRPRPFRRTSSAVEGETP